MMIASAEPWEPGLKDYFSASRTSSRQYGVPAHVSIQASTSALLVAGSGKRRDENPWSYQRRLKRVLSSISAPWSVCLIRALECRDARAAIIVGEMIDPRCQSVGTAGGPLLLRLRVVEIDSPSILPAVYVASFRRGGSLASLGILEDFVQASGGPCASRLQVLSGETRKESLR